ncbi:Ca2-binding protein [Aureococcus anophagefferens]|nr:Ca2-binding protein [Aureococcus anophagefferens]
MNVTDTSNPNEIEANEWEDAIESALARKLAARKAEREAEELIRQQLAKAAEEEEEAFANEFMNAARKCFAMIDKDGSGTLTKVEIVKAVKEDRSVVHFLRTCGEDNLQFLLQPARLEKALEVLDTSKDGEVDEEEWEEAVNRGLEKRLAALKEEQARRDRAARAADTEFSVEFLSAARKVFDMMDVDGSGSLDKGEVVKAVKTDTDVIHFLSTCGNPNLQYLLVPSRLNAALAELDTDRDGEINATEWEGAIERARREARAARIEEFTADFLNAARRCGLIGVDDSGTLTKSEITKAVRSNDEVIDFLVNCGEDNLQFLLKPKRLSKALDALDTSKDGELDIDEWEEAIYKGLASRVDTLKEELERRDRAAAAALGSVFSAAFLAAARAVFDCVDVEGAGTLTKAELLEALQGHGPRGSAVAKLVSECEHEALVALLEPDAMEKSLAKHKTLDADSIEANEWEALVESALKALLREREKQKADDEAIVQAMLATKAAKEEIAEAPAPSDDTKTWPGNGVGDEFGEGWDAADRPVTPGADEKDPNAMPDDLAALDAEKNAHANAEKPPTPRRTIRGANGQEISVHPDDEVFVEKFFANALATFKLIDLDDNGGMTFEEIQESIAEEPDVVKFLWTCGNLDMQQMIDEKRLPASFAKLDQDKDGEISRAEWDVAIQAALAIRLKRFEHQRERAKASGEAEDAEFREEFKKMARKVFFLIDTDGSGTLTVDEIMRGVRYEPEVKQFLETCGSKVLTMLLEPKALKQAMAEIDKNTDGEISVDEWDMIIDMALNDKLEKLRADRAKREAEEKAEEEEFTMKFRQLLHPKRLQHAMDELDTNNDGEISTEEWESAVEAALRVQLSRLSAAQKRRAMDARAEDEAYMAEFMAKARAVFDMIDTDGSGSLEKQEIVRSVTQDQAVIQFLVNCGEPNLQFLLVPRRLQKALDEIDTDGSGDVSKGEWEPATCVFQMLDADESMSLEMNEIVDAVKSNQKVINFLRDCGNRFLQELLEPTRLSTALAKLDTNQDGSLGIDEWEVFVLMDVDDSGTLTKAEIVSGVQDNEEPAIGRRSSPRRELNACFRLDADEWEAAITVGLKKRLKALEEERERRERAAKADDDAFSAQFLEAASKVFDMMDKDESGSLDKAEVVKAVKTDRKVIDFLKGCGNKNLQYLLVPSRLENALNALDTDRDGEINKPEWEGAIETALNAKLMARSAERDKRAAAARRELEEFTAEFLNAARKCFKMIDKDSSGTLTKDEIVKAVQEDKEVVKFLQTCGEENLQFLLQPKRLERALEQLDTSKDGEVDEDEWEEAIQKGLAKRIEQLKDERDRRERAAKADDEAFTAEFLSAARQVFDMIDVDASGSLDKGEVVKAVKTDKKVINFLVNCGNPNLQYLLVPARLESALRELDTDADGEITAPEWEAAIETALANKLEARALEREKKAKARKEIEEFTAEFLNAARQCFSMIDKDDSGTLTKEEIVKAVAEDKEVKDFLKNCGEENLQFLLQPKRLEKALQVLDTSKDGEVDVDEWEEAIQRGLAVRLSQLADERERRERAAAAEDEAFTAEFLNAAREVFIMIDADNSGSLDKAEVVKAVKTDKKVINFLINLPEWESAIETALANKLEARAAQREASAKAARKEIEEFTNEFLNAARQCFEMIDKDSSGTLTKDEIVKAVAEDKEVVLDTSKDGEVDIDEWEEAVHRGLAKRLEQLADERERADRAARAEDEAFTAEFLSAAREVFLMIDKDNSGSLDKAEVIKAVKTDKKVINFLVNCGNPNLQYLLVPARLESALNTLDTDRDGEINMPEWESAIETALANKLEARKADREKKAAAARKEIEEFTAEFLGAARKCFEMIDKDSSGTLTKTEIVKAVAEDKEVVAFLENCGEENLQFLLVPARLEKALEVLDTSKDGEVDADEWEEAIHRGLSKRLDQLAEERERRERAARAEDEAFTAEFLSAAREVFIMIDKDDSGSLDKAEVVKAVQTDKKVINFW